MKHSLLLFSFYFLVFSFLVGCKKDRSCDTPIGDASCRLELSDGSLSDLWGINGYVYIHGGNRGICVTHPATNEYRAFERTCPNDHDVAVVMRPNSDGLILECPSCGSQFLAIDGSPLEGSTTSCSLFQYDTRLNGTTLDIW